MIPLVEQPDSNDALSFGDLMYINNSMGYCPLCLIGEMQAGPRGGESINFRCLCCREEFWLAFFGAVTLTGGRIHRYEPDLYQGPLLSARFRYFDSIVVK